MASAQLMSSAKTWVAPSVASSKEAAKNAKWTKQDHFHEILVLEPGKNSYPITAGTFILLPKEKEWRQNQPFESIPMKRF